MNLRALYRILGAMLFALTLTVSLNIIFSPSTSATDTLSDGDKQFCTEMSAYLLKFDESADEPGTKDGNLYLLGPNASTTIRRCLGAKFCTLTDDNPAAGSTITCESSDGGEGPGSGTFPNPPATIPTGAKPLLTLMCSSYSGTMKQDCRGAVADVYINDCYTTKENPDKIDEWADCVYKSLLSNWIIFKNTYSSARPVPPKAKIKEALQQGMSDSEAAIGDAESKQCEADGGTYDVATGTCKTADKTSCSIDGIGWLICPVMNFLAEVNEKAFGFLQSLLGVRPALTTDEGTKKAWSAFRDIANVAFVIAFLVIIYSQITSVGVSNYGIKKLLPKIAIAAIMVNLSLFACQILVDLSNIAGASLYSFISGLVHPLTGTGFEQDSAWSSLMEGVLVAGVGVLLVVMVVVAPTVLLALGLILLILVARQAFVLILIIISPLAFVAYLLPNTEGLFKKWWKALTATLLVYPIVAIIFGASTLASNILMGIASDQGNTGATDMSDDNQMLAIVALAVMAIPLFAVPAILKGAMSAAGTIGAKLQGMADKSQGRAAKQAGASFKRHAESIEGRMAASNNRYARFAGGYRNRRNFRHKSTEEQTARNQEEGLLQHITAHPNRYSDQQRAAAAATLDKRYEEEVKGAGASLQLNASHDEILAAAQHGTLATRDANGNVIGTRRLSEHERDAAVRYAMDRGNFEERQAIATGVGDMTRSQRKSLASGMRAKGDTAVYGNQAIAELERTDHSDEQGGTGMDATAARAALQAGVVRKINAGELSVSTITSDHRVAGFVRTAAPGANAPALDRLRDDIATYQTDNAQEWARLDSETKARASTI